MKKMLAILAALLLLLPSARAEEGFFYSVASVTDCAQTSAAYDRFYQSGELSVIIPGLAEGFVPQGISWMPEEGWLLFAGYSAGKENSALLAVDYQTGELKKEARLLNTDGSGYTGHAGGVCVTETDIYVSNAHTLFRISLDAFRALPAASECAFEEEIPVPVNSSYCCYAEGILWVGEFQYGGDYPTDASHRVSTADRLQRAWTCGYQMREGQDFSVPDYILSMTERIQGITTLEGKIYLSQSYGRRNDSVIYQYREVLTEEPDESVQFNGREVPLWILDRDTRESAMICPPMTECLCTVNGEILVAFESAALSYMNPLNPSLNPMDRVFRLRAW